MYGDALNALQTLTIITALPLMFVMGLMIASFLKWLKEDQSIHFEVKNELDETNRAS